MTEVCWRQRTRMPRYVAEGSRAAAVSVSTAMGTNRCSVFQSEVGIFDACRLPLSNRRLQGPKAPAKGQHTHGEGEQEVQEACGVRWSHREAGIKKKSGGAWPKFWHLWLVEDVGTSVDAARGSS